MKLWTKYKSAVLASLIALVTAGLIATSSLSRAQAPANAVPRLPDGRPNLNGIWQANNTANWDLLTHRAKQGPLTSLGAAFSVPGGIGVVAGNEIPYKPEALGKKQENAGHWITADPEVKCYLPGVPRATYLPYPFQIVQSGGTSDMLITYEFASASRIARMNTKSDSPSPPALGWSRGGGDGDTLVIDVTSFNGQAWFDRAGDYQTDRLHVVERYTMTGPDAFRYDVTIEDPQLYTRPWKMSMPVYRRLEKDAQLVEYKCVEFVEELLY